MATGPQAATLRRWRRWALVLCGTALAYVLCGQLALLLALPPVYAAPLFPSAGVALAACLVFGRAAWPGVLLGGLIVNGLLIARLTSPFGVQWVLPLVMALGATAQAMTGAALLRWRLPGPLALAEPRQVALFCLLAGPVTCLVSASVAVLALVTAGQLPPEARLFTWWTWWAGDTLGVLIGAPITLSLVGRPRADWSGRRAWVALPLLGTTVLMALATLQVARWDAQRLRTSFDRDASHAALAMESRLQRALFALEAMHGLYTASNQVTLPEMAQAAQPWLDGGLQLQALGHAERVARRDLASYQARASAEDHRPLRLFDRPTGGQAAVHQLDDDMLAIRHIVPASGNEAALGVNVLSIPAARQAALAALDSGRPQATPGFRLTQETGDQTGVVVYQALFQPMAGGQRGDWQGAVFVSLRMDQTLQAAMADAPTYLQWCLLDDDPQAQRRRLAGRTGCEQPTAAAGGDAQPLLHRHPLGFAGRQWQLVLQALPAQVPNAGNGNAWLFSTVGLLSVAMLAALLLTVTGRARRIEVAVAERTADLQREVAERQRTEAALRESEHRLRSIFDHAPIGIAYADLQGRLHEANPRLREMLGLGDGPLQAGSLASLMPPQERADEARALAGLLAGERSEARRRTQLRHHSGQLLSVQLNWQVLRSPLGAPLRLVAVVEDITDQLLRQQAEQRQQLAESANQAKNEFLSRMSHELRTPLNAMLGFGQLLQLDSKPALAPHQRGWTAHILRAGWHLLEMINDTLDLSRIEAGMMRLTPSAVNLPALLQDCMDMVRTTADQRAVSLRLQLDPSAALAWADATRLKQVVINLLSNAVKYNVEGGTVLLATRTAGPQQLEIRVHDTGPGLSAAQLAGLFQPFNRLGREQGPVEGHGIGLVISRRLAELMGGSLQAHSAEGQGATFVLTVPMAEASPALAQSAGDNDDSRWRYRLRQVHYIEDNPTNAEVMAGVLSQRPQVRLTVSATGAEGLAAVRQQRPDLVLLDMHLPDADGLDLLRRLKRDPATRRIPVLVVSADATPGRIEQALAAGALHYLTKPLDLGSFLNLVDQVLDEIDSQFGDLDG